MYFCYLTFPVRVCSGNKFGIKWPQKAWKETPFLMEGSWPFGLVVEVQQQHRAQVLVGFVIPSFLQLRCLWEWCKNKAMLSSAVMLKTSSQELSDTSPTEYETFCFALAVTQSWSLSRSLEPLSSLFSHVFFFFLFLFRVYQSSAICSLQPNFSL